MWYSLTYSDMLTVSIKPKVFDPKNIKILKHKIFKDLTAKNTTADRPKAGGKEPYKWSATLGCLWPVIIKGYEAHYHIIICQI